MKARAKNVLKMLPVLAVVIIALLAVKLQNYLMLPQGDLYSTGQAVTSNGDVVAFDDKLIFRGGGFSYAMYSSWGGKINVGQVGGEISPGYLGDIRFKLNRSANHGSPLLGDPLLDNSLAFNQSFARSKGASFSVVPIAGDFSGLCFYIIELSKAQCGGKGYWRERVSGMGRMGGR
jgi:hypothetical protein